MGKKRRKALCNAFVLMVLFVFLLSSCSMFSDGFGLVTAPARGSSGTGGTTSSGQTDQDQPEPESDAPEPGTSSSGRDLAYSPSVSMFGMIFAQAFYLGGFYAGFGTYREGQGTVWEISYKENGKPETFTAERALLKVNADNSLWWYIKYEVDEEVFAYEVLVTPEFEARKIRFKDEEGAIREYAFDAGEAGGGTAATARVFDLESDSEYQKYLQGKRPVNTSAGKFNTDYLRVTYMNQGVDAVYEWWVSDEVPGKLVRFKWEDKDNKTTLSGELVSIKTGYTTRFNSF
jgi:hypothetical protein